MRLFNGSSLSLNFLLSRGSLQHIYSGHSLGPNQSNQYIHIRFADSKYGVVFVLGNKNLFNSRGFGMLEQKKHNVA